MRVFSAVIVAILGLASVQSSNETATNYDNGLRNIQQNFFNFFDAIGKNDARQSGTYRDILAKETRNEQQAFDSMKDEFRSARLRNVDQRRPRDKNGHTDLGGAVLKRNAGMSPNGDELLKSRARSKATLNDYNFTTKMSIPIKRVLSAVDADKALLDSARPLSPTVAKSLSEKLKVELTYHSNAIEGNQLTLEENWAVINGSTVADKSLKDVKEAENHAKAVDFITELAKENRSLTETDILDIHAVILAEIRPDDAGRYRTSDVKVGMSLAPEHIYVAGFVASLLKWYNEVRDIHPIIRAAIFHARFEIIHPFIDGNGRTGRLIANLELMKLNYPPGIIRLENVSRYYNAIRIAQTANEYGEMTLEIARSLYETLDMYLTALNLGQGRVKAF